MGGVDGDSDSLGSCWSLCGSLVFVADWARVGCRPAGCVHSGTQRLSAALQNQQSALGRRLGWKEPHSVECRPAQAKRLAQSSRPFRSCEGACRPWSLEAEKAGGAKMGKGTSDPDGSMGVLVLPYLAASNGPCKFSVTSDVVPARLSMDGLNTKLLVASGKAEGTTQGTDSFCAGTRLAAVRYVRSCHRTPELPASAGVCRCVHMTKPYDFTTSAENGGKATHQIVIQRAETLVQVQGIRQLFKEDSTVDRHVSRRPGDPAL